MSTMPGNPTDAADAHAQATVFPTAAPVLDEPVLDEPVLDEPVLDEPVLDEPVLDEPVLDEPVLDEPVLDEPVLDEIVRRFEAAARDCRVEAPAPTELLSLCGQVATFTRELFPGEMIIGVKNDPEIPDDLDLQHYRQR